jgi:pimeloyl-ACP methyl ester carboxylesterase
VRLSFHRGAGLLLAGMLAAVSAARADSPLHTEVLVFVPAYEGSRLFDPALKPPDDDPPCVWGSIDGMTDSDLYFSLRMPNPLTAQPMLTAGPLDIYGDFVNGITDDHDSAPRFHPYTEGADFFIFAYDWRQEIATVTAPLFGQALEKYAAIHAAKTGIPAEDTRFVIVAHSMGGLVARTFLSENPDWADRVSRLYLVGTPNLGSVKTIKTIVTGPGGLKENALNFPASLLNLLPNDVNANITKLVAITRPSLYELLPFQDPRWECVAADGSRTRIAAPDLLNIAPWEPYWPTAELERKLFIDDWLKKRIAEGRKKIVPRDWEFCQDPDYGPLQRMLAQVREWRLKMGSLSYTDTLMTRPNEDSRLKVVMGTGLKTPTGIITEGAHDFTTARYTYAPDNDGDETVTGVSVLDDLHPSADNLKLLIGVGHGKLMTDPQFLDYFYDELSSRPVLVQPAGTVSSPPPHVLLVPGSSVP